MKTENLSRIIEFLQKNCNADIDFNYHLQNEEDNINSAEDIRDILDNAGAFNVEIIYYSKAIEYLSNSDPSLRESLRIAAEMGYSIENLNSETLASLLASEEAREAFSDIESELDSLIEEITEEEEEEEEEEENEDEDEE